MRTGFIITCGLLLTSCGTTPNNQNNRLSENDTLAIPAVTLADTTRMLVADLPVAFDSTDVILTTVSYRNIESREGLKEFYSSSSRSELRTYSGRDEISGRINNIVFREKDGTERKLTNEKVSIRSVNFLRELFKKTGRPYLVYTLSDRDSNRDGEIDQQDLTSLFISALNGSGFQKLTPERHQLIDWEFFELDQHLYYRTQEDKNKDGEFTTGDPFHYYMVDFANGTPAKSEYNPLKLF